jgi:cytochrome c-type biogenesis protein CcmH
MTLWLVLAVMTAAAIFAVAWPLIRQGTKPRSGSDIAVYRDQLDEIRRDQAAGRIGDSEAEAAQVEVSRRLLAAADAEENAVAAPIAATPRRGIAVAALAIMSLGAATLYLVLGSPDMPGQPLAQREPNPSIETLIAQVESHLARNPNDGRGWEVIAPIYLRLGRFSDAIKARRNALALGGETSERQASLAEALAAAEDGKIGPEAKAAFERAVALDGANIKARYYLGLAAEQEGRTAEAAEIWGAIVAAAPPDAPYAQFIRQEVARISGGERGPSEQRERGPTARDVAAASDLGPEQRTAMIRGMVAQLAERLNKDGSDLEGWLRLVRSYMVLGERDKAQAAAVDARRALAREPDKLRRIEELVKGLGLEG